MKTIAAILLAGLTSLQAGEFVNLNFESANTNHLSSIPGDLLQVGVVSDLLPGWTVLYSSSNVTTISYSGNGDRWSGVTLVARDPATSVEYGRRFGIDIYSTTITPGHEGVGFMVSLSQVGLIPSSARYLEIIPGFESAIISINESVLPTKYGDSLIDVSKYAGEEVKLEIQFPGRGVTEFDIIGFTSVPEPSEIAMLVMGLGVIGWQVWRRHGEK